MKFSATFRNNVLKKTLPPENKSVSEVSKEMGVSIRTIQYWKQKLINGTLESSDTDLRPEDRSPAEKLSLLLEAKSMPQDGLGAWLRENGLHSEHLNLWEQELRDTVVDKSKKIQEENKQLKKDNRRLEKELKRKEAALAEMAALMVLKKKADEIWGEPGDD